MKDFASFFELQRQANKEYYSRKGINLYEDFGTTVSKSSKISVAQALEFYARMVELEKKGMLPSELVVHEYGIGNGAFAAFFLETMKKLDEKNKTDYYRKIRYTLGDISEKLLDDVKKRKEVKEHEKILEFVELDATNLPFNKKNVLYVRSSEVWDDLPALLLVKQKNEVHEVLTREGKNRVEMKAASESLRNCAFKKIVFETMQEMPEGFAVPVSIGAAECLKQCASIMDFERGAILDIIDYGFTSAEEVEREGPKELWNEFAVRIFGTQLTVDVNFLFLTNVARELGLEAKNQPTVKYLENVFMERIYPVTLGTGKRAYVGYLNAKEASERKKELENAGYSKEFLQGEISEDDGYYAMRVCEQV